VNERVARSRALIAQGHRQAIVTRVLQVSRQSVYCPISRRPVGAGPGRGRPGDELIVEVAKANPADGTRMVAALASRAVGDPVNRKRAQRVMRRHRLLQRSCDTDRRRRPGFLVAGWSRRSPRHQERTYADARLRGPDADLSLLVEAGRVVAS